MSTLRIETTPHGIATVTLDRPDTHNAMDAAMIAELHEAAETLGADETVRAVVLTGAGRSFCAGGDLNWMRAQFEADRATRMAEARRLALMLRAWNVCPKPVIGRVQGQAFGGGVGLISVCDVAIGVDGARFGLTETRLGLIPATIGPYVVARLGEGVARRVFFSARLFDAAEAVSLGLLARTVPVEALDDAIAREVTPYLHASPQAVSAAKAFARALGPRIDDAAIEESVRRLADTWETEDAREGIAAFFEKRRPAFAAD
ncbi:MAG: crotonase/enoyl-CoA hydratase family protein [Pseudomonadota bacterium]